MTFDPKNYSKKTTNFSTDLTSGSYEHHCGYSSVQDSKSTSS